MNFQELNYDALNEPGIENIVLAVADAASAQVASDSVLVQHLTLAVQDAASAHTAGEIALLHPQTSRFGGGNGELEEE